MNISEIKALAATIEYDEIHEEMDISEFIFSEYSKRLKLKFDDLFSKFRPKKKLIQQFKTMCEENWNLVKGTALCYTSEPNCIETRLFVSIAQFLEQNAKEDKSAFEYLMPGVTYENAKTEYPNLKDIDLSMVLKTYILGDNQLYLVPVKLLTEFNLSPSQGRLDNPYFHVENHEIEHWKISKNEIVRLFAHSDLTKELYKAKLDAEMVANQSNNLLGQLRHLCKFLRMASILEQGTEEDATEDLYQVMFQFMDYFNKLYARRLITASSLPLNLENDIGHVFWIGRHTLYTINPDGQAQELPIENLGEFKQRLKKLRNDHPNEKRNMLLSVLEWDSLCQDLVNFSPIDPRISPGLKHEILYLFRMTTQTRLNAASHEDTESCVMKRREALVALVEMQEPLLSEISIENMTQEYNIETQTQQFSTKREAIITALENEEYSGFDPLNHYSLLLQRMGLSYEIFMEEQLSFINDYPTDEIQELYTQNPQFIVQTIGLFENLNDFVFYLLTLPSEKIIFLLSLLKPELKKTFVSNLTQLINLVKTLDADTCGKVIGLYAEGFFVEWNHLSILGEELEVAHFRMVCSQLKSFILTHLTVQRFHEMSNQLPNDVFVNAFHEVVFPQLPQIVLQINDYVLIKQVLMSPHDDIFFDEMHPRMKKLMLTAKDYSQYMGCLMNRQQAMVLQEFIPEAPELIHSLEDLKHLFTNLGLKSLKDFCLVYGDFIVNHLNSPAEIYELFEVLNVRQQELLGRIFEVHFHHVILNSKNHTQLSQIPGLFQNLYELKPFTLHISAISSPKFAKKLAHHIIFENEEELKIHLQRMVSFRLKQRFFSSEPVGEQIFNAIQGLPRQWRQQCFRSLSTNDRCSVQDFLRILQVRHEDEPSAKKLKSEKGFSRSNY